MSSILERVDKKLDLLLKTEGKTRLAHEIVSFFKPLEDVYNVRVNSDGPYEVSLYAVNEPLEDSWEVFEIQIDHEDNFYTLFNHQYHSLEELKEDVIDRIARLILSNTIIKKKGDI